MNIYKKLLNRDEKMSIIGLGYVGLPIGIAFSKTVDVIGFDINLDKITSYQNGIDITKEVGNNAIINSSMVFTNSEEELRQAKFHIVAVPTPINSDKTPNLTPVISASKLLGKNLVKGSYVVYESTVYPGVTEEICIPILEKESNLKCGIDFKVGYSPERINPSDKVHTLETIVKIVSAMDGESLDIIAKVYELVVKAGVYKANSIKVAEAAKVIENSQRDINIAFVNELSIIFNKLGIDTKSVLEAAGTKWNFLNFTPGLVGGHCIGVDPYYLTYKAERMGYQPQVILSGRRINDNMGKHIAEVVIKKVLKSKNNISNVKIGILGFTFKENCQDTRNTKVFDIITELKDYNLNPIVCDPVADAEEAIQEYNINLVNMEELKDLDVLIVAVNHDEFIKLNELELSNMLKSNSKIVIDVKGIFDKDILESKGFNYWRL